MRAWSRLLISNPEQFAADPALTMRRIFPPHQRDFRVLRVAKIGSRYFDGGHDCLDSYR